MTKELKWEGWTTEVVRVLETLIEITEETGKETETFEEVRDKSGLSDETFEIVIELLFYRGLVDIRDG